VALLVAASPVPQAASLPVTAARVPANEDEAETRAFYGAIELEARQFYDAHAQHMPQVQRALWDRLVRQSVLRLQQAGIGMKSLARYARPAAGTFVVTNIVSTFILPPILTAIGMPGLAMLVLAAPFEPFVAAGQVFIMRSMDDMRLMRTVGLEDFMAMKKLRRELLGMPERKHVITLIESDLLQEIRSRGGPLWLSVSTAKESSGSSVALRELEEVVRKSAQGELWLEELTPEKLSRHLYALELWFYIQERPELRRDLAERLKSLSGASPNALLSKQMHEILDLKRSLNEAEEALSKTIKASFGPLSSGEKQALERFIGDVSEQTSQVLRAADLAENHILLSMVRGAPLLVDDLSWSMKLMQERLALYREAELQARKLGEDRYVTAASLRKTLHFVEAPVKAPGVCFEAIRSLLKAR
jgi:hypothetical protein